MSRYVLIPGLVSPEAASQRSLGDGAYRSVHTLPEALHAAASRLQALHLSSAWRPGPGQQWCLLVIPQGQQVPLGHINAQPTIRIFSLLLFVLLLFLLLLLLFLPLCPVRRPFLSSSSGVFLARGEFLELEFLLHLPGSFPHLLPMAPRNRQSRGHIKACITSTLSLTSPVSDHPLPQRTVLRSMLRWTFQAYPHELFQCAVSQQNA